MLDKPKEKSIKGLKPVGPERYRKQLKDEATEALNHSKMVRLRYYHLGVIGAIKKMDAHNEVYQEVLRLGRVEHLRTYKADHMRRAREEARNGGV